MAAFELEPYPVKDIEGDGRDQERDGCRPGHDLVRPVLAQKRLDGMLGRLVRFRMKPCPPLLEGADTQAVIDEPFLHKVIDQRCDGQEHQEFAKRPQGAHYLFPSSTGPSSSAPMTSAQLRP